MTTSQLDVRLGSQTPRVSNYPAYDLSGAPEVIDLAASAGLHLDEWQKYVLTHGLGMRTDGRWTASKVSTWVPRQNGKGAIIEALELAWLFLLGEEEIVHSAHQQRTSDKAYIRLERLIRGTPWMHKRVHAYRQANGKQQIELNSGQILDYVTRSRSATRGFSAKKIILDEAQELTSEQMAAILPTVSAMFNHQVWFLGTPPDDEAAWVYGLREDGEDGVPRLAHFDWGTELVHGAPATLAAAADPELWYACNPALGVRIEHDTVVDEYRPSGLGVKFPQERLGAWKPRALEGGGVIDPRLWSAMADLESRRVGDVALAVDVTPLRDHASISMYGLRADGLGHVQVVTYGEGVDWVVGKLVELKAALDPIAIGMDPKGGAASLLGDFEAVGIKPPEDPEFPGRGDLALPLVHEVAQGVGQFIDAARQRQLRHTGQVELTSAVANAKTRPLADAVAWGRKQSDVDISPLVSATLARWAYVTRISVKDKAVALTGSLMA